MDVYKKVPVISGKGLAFITCLIPTTSPPPPPNYHHVIFSQIQEAHDVLLSSKQRAQYNHQMNQDKYYGGQHRPEDGSRYDALMRGINAYSFLQFDFTLY